MKIKFMQGYGLFVQDKTMLCSDKTQDYYISCLKYFMEFITNEKEKKIEDIYLDEITSSDLKNYIIYLRTRQKFLGNKFVDLEDHANKKLQKSSINTYQRGLKAFFSYCYQENLMNYDVASNYKLIKVDTKEKIPLYAHEVELIDKMYNLKTETGIRNLCVVHLFLDAGLRLNELIELRICDCMFDKNLLLLHGKGNKERIVPLAKKLKSYLTKYLIQYRRISVNQQGNIDCYKDDYVFLNLKTRQHIEKTVITMMFRRIKEKTRIERVHPHLLRHTFATSYMLHGGNLESLRILMGHTDIQTTVIYLHLANKYKMLNADVYKLDPCFFKTI